MNRQVNSFENTNVNERGTSRDLLDAEVLKVLLRGISDGQTTWPKEQELVLINSMIKHIGSPDSELRDTLIYRMFCKLIVEEKMDHQLLTSILMQILSDEMLFYEIQEKESDAVFTRSFSTLVIALILFRNSQENFLSHTQIIKTKDSLIRYIDLENDLRGFVQGKGWAHSIAHVADAFEALILNQTIGEEIYSELIEALWAKVFVSNTSYIHDEEERVLIPILAMLRASKDMQLILRLMGEVSFLLEKYKSQLEEEHYWILYSNVKKFLKSFYILLENESGFNELKEEVKKQLSTL